MTGTNTATGEASDPGFTIHTDWAGMVFPYPDDFASWGVELTPNCVPMLNVFVNFADDTRPPGTLTVGDFEGQGIGLDVVALEMHAGASSMDATVRVTDTDGARASGYMVGAGSSAFLGLIPEEALTGQRLSVEAFAFQDIVTRDE